MTSNNVTYIETMHRQWAQDPSAVPAAWDAYFRGDGKQDTTAPKAEPATGQNDMAYKQSRVDSLLWAYRDIGYRYARLNPLGGDHGPYHDYISRDESETRESLTLEGFRIPATDLDTVFSAGRVMKPSPAPLRDIVAAFEETYCGPIGVEFLHIQEQRIRHWLIEKMESTHNRPKLSADQHRTILEDLLRTEALENALGRFFVGQKRFSLEGCEAIIPALHFLVDSAARYDIDEFVLGTTHRGRLAILDTILHMTPGEMVSTFKEEPAAANVYRTTGDVRYHIGYETDHALDNGESVHISMCANASHLESIDAIVLGKARALQDKIKDQQRTRVVPVLLHGDAAFSGQGIVAEVLNLSRLSGYRTGGTIHMVINNQIGFTTAAHNARSSAFCTDVAKGLGVPIFHVNGDDPEALVYAANLGLQFRQEFHADCIIDVFCYRRHGHNETDEPSFTHPQMYRIIKGHPSVATTYGKHCADSGVVRAEEQASIKQGHINAFKEALHNPQTEPITKINGSQGEAWERLDREYSHDVVKTRVDESVLRRVGQHLMTVPEGFHVHPTLGRNLQRKKNAFDEQSQVDWATGEALAFGSLLLEGAPVRLSGQDCVRGTFAQRHLTWWDRETEKPLAYTPLGTLADDQGELALVDSPLSEYSILGFEYGYSLIDPNALVLWEAQFGDFANGAQVVIDNYITSAQSKWNRCSGLVLLLPHGNEGQGPDHSSAHLARFLQLAACDNMQICNLTTPAQYFHMLRRQVKTGFRIPLIVMTPKSLLRHPEAVSGIDDLARGSFHEVLDDVLHPKQVDRIILCAGKVYYDLVAQRETAQRSDAAVIRLEQLYPFPEQALRTCLARYELEPEVMWMQDEHRNYGAWLYMRECFSVHFPHIDLKYSGRQESASSATGTFTHYQEDQKRLIREAFE